jgi:phosphoenolpyruvate-protein phosphotransferase
MNNKPLRRKRGGSPTDEFPLVTRIHDVVNSTGIMKWHFPSHRNWSELRGDLQRFERRGVGGTESLTPLALWNIVDYHATNEARASCCTLNRASERLGFYVAKKETSVRLAGRAISSGLVIGSAFVYRERLEAIAKPYEIEKHQVAEELLRIEQAMETVRQDLQVSAHRIEADTTAKLAEIFQVHEAMLQDPTLRKEICDLVEGELIDGSQALARVFRRWERKFRTMTEQVQQQHADDVADLSRRLLREMAGIKTTSLEKMPSGRVLVARRLLPSDTVALPRQAVAGIVVDFGGQGSHAALLAEALGIPTVAQIPNVTEKIADDDVLIVDGFHGEVVINPDAATQARYAAEIQSAQAGRVQIKELARQPACTLDGTPVAVLANVGGREDVAVAAENGADGVGLYRMEQFYLSLKTPPCKTELLAELRETFAPLKGKPVTVRLLDLGGDKPLPFLRIPLEDNPFLGRRGIRFLLHYPDLLDTQLQALLEFSEEHDVRVLIPMVTLAEDMRRVRERFEDAARAAGRERLPPLGAMVETPAAALSTAEIAACSDFLSIGTNDLTQYTMAAGRENPLVNDYFVEDHPAVMRLVRMVAEEAGNIPVAICGELARQLGALPAVLKWGIHTLSVAPPLVPRVKEAVRQIRL